MSSYLLKCSGNLSYNIASNLNQQVNKVGVDVTVSNLTIDKRFGSKSLPRGKNRSLNHPARIYLLLECNPLVLDHSWVYFFMLVPLGFVGPTGCCSQYLRSDCARDAKTAMTSFLSERLGLQSCNASSSCPRLNSHCLSVQFCFLLHLSWLNEPCFSQRSVPRDSWWKCFVCGSKRTP